MRGYARGLAAFARRSPAERYYQHFEADGGGRPFPAGPEDVLQQAIRHATRRTAERAARKLTETDADGRMRFVESPPTMTHADPEVIAAVQTSLDAYLLTTNADIRLLIGHYVASDTVRRVVGVGSVGTRCYLTVMQDGDGNALLLQTKEAGRSVLVEYGGCAQPPTMADLFASRGQGGRVVAMQRILQGVSDPLLGYLKGHQVDYYVRQFRDMKGGIDAETLDDESFRLYALACAAALARAHGQSRTAAQVVGYIGKGDAVADAIVAWSYAYADVSRRDYEAFVDASR